MDIIANTVANLFYEHRYIFAFLGALFEGTFIMILAGVFYKLGYFNFWGLMAVLVGGYITNGLIWYAIGRFGGHKILEKWGRRIHLTRNIIERLEDYFQRHSVKTLFITRITYGLSMYAFMIAGSFKMNMKKFLTVSFAATVVWVLVLTGLGYVFGVSYGALAIVNKTITVGLAVLISVVIVLISFLVIYWLRKIAKTEFMEKLSENNQSQFLRWLGGKISNLGKK